MVILKPCSEANPSEEESFDLILNVLTRRPLTTSLGPHFLVTCFSGPDTLVYEKVIFLRGFREARH